MTYEAFMETVQQGQPPDGISAELLALWHAAAGKWSQAHTIAQDIPSRNGSWIHAFLHREEGDIFNARYWYSSAGQPEHSGSLDEELDELIRRFLAS